MINAPLPAGYKQTEVGIIPEDWEVKSMADCCSKITDGTHDTPKPIKAGIPFLTAIHVKENFIDFDGCYYLSEETHKTIYSRCNPERNDVLMVNIGAGVATTALVNVDYEFSLKNVALLKPNIFLIGAYLNYWQSKNKSKITNSISTGGAQPFLSLKQISDLKIAIPIKTEQTAIATALSDTDALINALDKLIAKKCLIKQGAMQQLLSGKKRLAGFSGEWEVKKIDELVEFLDGKREPIKDSDRSKMKGIFPYYGASGIIDYVNDYIFDDNLILLGEDGENILSRNCKLAFQVSGKIWVNNHAHVLKPKEEFDITFLTEKLESLNYEQFNTGTAQPKLNKKVTSQILITIPPTKEEQTAIAQILSDMDNEIAALEKRRTKTQQIKQGMMQELLTGKTRLI